MDRVHDVVDCPARGGGLLLVLDEAHVGRTVDGAVHAVGGQGGQVVLLLGPAGGASASGGEDDQRFGAEVSKRGAEASAWVAETGGRGKARRANARNAARAEVFEEALNRVSRRLAVLSRRSATDLRTERLAAAKASRTVGPARAARKEQSGGPGQARAHRQTTGGQNRDASTRSAGARLQAGRDAR